MTGPPGAGKSTVARLLVDEMDKGVLVEGDEFFSAIGPKAWIPPWEPASRRQNGVVIDAIGAAAGRYAGGGYEVVVDGIVGPWLLDRFVAAASLPVSYVVLRPSSNVAMARATARGEPWLVEPVPIAKMYEEFSDLGSHETYVVDSTSLDAEATAGEVRRRLAKGELSLP